MLQWASHVASAVIAAVVTAALLGYLHRRGTRRRAAALREGRPTSFKAFLRAPAAPYPRRWREGVVTLGVGPPTWKATLGLRRSTLRLPVSASVDSMRGAASFGEKLATTPDSIIVVAHSGEGDVELAVRAFDFRTAIQALEVGTGGAWRINIPLRPEIVVVHEPSNRPALPPRSE